MTIIHSRQKMPASRGSRSTRSSRRAPRLRSSSFRRKTALPIFPQAAFGGECQISRRVSVFGRGRAASLRTPPCALRCTIARRSRVSGSSRRVRPPRLPRKALSLSASRRAVSIPWTPRGSSATNCPPSSDRWREGSSTAESPGSTSAASSSTPRPGAVTPSATRCTGRFPRSEAPSPSSSACPSTRWHASPRR